MTFFFIILYSLITFSLSNECIDYNTCEICLILGSEECEWCKEVEVREGSFSTSLTSQCREKTTNEYCGPAQQIPVRTEEICATLATESLITAPPSFNVGTRRLSPGWNEEGGGGMGGIGNEMNTIITIIVSLLAVFLLLCFFFSFLVWLKRRTKRAKNGNGSPSSSSSSSPTTPSNHLSRSRYSSRQATRGQIHHNSGESKRSSKRLTSQQQPFVAPPSAMNQFHQFSPLPMNQMQMNQMQMNQMQMNQMNQMQMNQMQMHQIPMQDQLVHSYSSSPPAAPSPSSPSPSYKLGYKPMTPSELASAC